MRLLMRTLQKGRSGLTAKLMHHASWSAFVSAVATILGVVTLLMFFGHGEPWGAINDVTSIVLAVSLLPVLLLLHRLHMRDAPVVSLAACAIGALGLIVVIVLQGLLVLRVISFAHTAIAVPLAFGLFGAALIVYGYLACSQESLPPGMGWLGIIAGAGYVTVIAGFLLGGEQHPLAAIGGLTASICYPIWAIWFGYLLVSGRWTT